MKLVFTDRHHEPPCGLDIPQQGGRRFPVHDPSGEPPVALRVQSFPALDWKGQPARAKSNTVRRDPAAQIGIVQAPGPAKVSPQVLPSPHPKHHTLNAPRGRHPDSNTFFTFWLSICRFCLASGSVVQGDAQNSKGLNRIQNNLVQSRYREIYSKLTQVDLLRFRWRQANLIDKIY